MQKSDTTIENRSPLSLPSASEKTCQDGPRACANGQSDGVIQFPLTPEQERLLVPLVRSAVAAKRNILFIGTCAPAGRVWRFQVVSVAPALGFKLRSLLEGTINHRMKEPAPPH